MKRIVEYQLLRGEFDALVEHLIEEGKYHTHGYRGMNVNTIDDGSSSGFDDCSRFSTFEVSGRGKLVTLRVEDSQLAKIVDSYFTSR